MMKTSIIGAPLTLARSQRIPATLKCYAATANSELLRSQLDRLHAEAESTRAKANSNRLRLLRLSEAAENLRKQAAICVHTGKENEARELLLQKKKVMQALDKAKARIELLDTLSSKLNEAISVKETKLIGNISLDLEVDRDNTSGGIHIVSPKLESTEDGHENDATSLDSQATFDTDNHVLDTLSSKLNEAICVKETKLIRNISLDLEVDRDDTSGGIHIVSPKLESTEDRHENDQTSLDSQDVEEYQDIDSLSGSRIFKESSSYESFLGNLDEKLSRIEAELVTIVNVASLVLNHEDKHKNLKVQQTTEILEEIRHVRQRIANIIYKEADIS